MMKPSRKGYNLPVLLVLGSLLLLGIVLFQVQKKLRSDGESPAVRSIEALLTAEKYEEAAAVLRKSATGEAVAMGQVRALLATRGFLHARRLAEKGEKEAASRLIEELLSVLPNQFDLLALKAELASQAVPLTPPSLPSVQPEQNPAPAQTLPVEPGPTFTPTEVRPTLQPASPAPPPDIPALAAELEVSLADPDPWSRGVQLGQKIEKLVELKALERVEAIQAAFSKRVRADFDALLAKKELAAAENLLLRAQPLVTEKTLIDLRAKLTVAMKPEPSEDEKRQAEVLNRLTRLLKSSDLKGAAPEYARATKELEGSGKKEEANKFVTLFKGKIITLGEAKLEKKEFKAAMDLLNTGEQYFPDPEFYKDSITKVRAREKLMGRSRALQPAPAKK